MVFTPSPYATQTALQDLSDADRALILRHTGPLDQIEGNDDGTSVFAIRINGAWVLRLARSPDAPLARETRLLSAIAPALPVEMRHCLPLPELVGDGWTLHRHLPGQPTGQADLAALTTAQRARFLAEFGALLTALHALPPTPEHPVAETPHAPDHWRGVLQEAETELFPLVSAMLARDLRAALVAMIETPLELDSAALLHDDLHTAHILHDPETGALTGLLDFGRSGRGDPAVDIAGLLYNWGSEAVAALGYPNLANLLPRARRLARTYEVQWALEGLHRQDNRWFLYALGAAKGF
ncbi:MAG: phosphotransferase family protein [Elstera sp.]